MNEGLTLLRELHAEAYPLMAGDVDGHEFHGNQWTGGAPELKDMRGNSIEFKRGGAWLSPDGRQMIYTNGDHGETAGKISEQFKIGKETDESAGDDIQEKGWTQVVINSDTIYGRRDMPRAQVETLTHLAILNNKSLVSDYGNNPKVFYQPPKLESRSAIMAAGGDDVTQAIVRLQQQGKLPSSLTQGTVDAMRKSLRRYFDKISNTKIDEFADEARKAVEATLHTEQEVRPAQELTTTVGTGTGEASSQVTAFLEEATGTNVAQRFNMDFFQRIAREVALGAGKQVAMNLDQTRVDEYPALELVRVYDREIPRGERREKGVIVDDEENGWPARWEAAGGELIDGRMVALKDSDIWQALGDGEGGYDDTLGNSFAPFAFNSGMDTDEVNREDAVALGLMDDEDEAQGADLDFDELIALPTEAKMYAASVRHRALMAEEVGHEFHGNQWTDAEGVIHDLTIDSSFKAAVNVKSGTYGRSIANHSDEKLGKEFFEKGKSFRKDPSLVSYSNYGARAASGLLLNNKVPEGLLGQSGKTFNEENTKSLISGVDKVFEQAPFIPKGVEMYHGAGANWSRTLNSLKVGDSVSSKNYISTSTNPSLAVKNFSTAFDEDNKSVVVRIISDGKIKGIGGFSRGESEVLLPHNQEFKIVSKETVNSLSFFKEGRNKTNVPSANTDPLGYHYKSKLTVLTVVPVDRSNLQSKQSIQASGGDVRHRALMAGDVAGHEFRGNQWTHFNAGEETSNHPAVQKQFDGMESGELDSEGHNEIGNVMSRDDLQKEVKIKDGKIVGAVGYRLSKIGKNLSIHHMGSVEKGTGTEMVNKLREKFPDRNVIARDVKTSAIGFYKKLGFQHDQGDDWKLPAKIVHPILK